MKAPSPNIDENSIVRGLTQEPLPFMEGLNKDVGEWVSLKIKNLDITLINDPLAIEEVFRDGDNYKKKKDDAAESEYLNMMAGICSMYAPERLDLYFQRMSEAASRSAERLLSHAGTKEIDIFHEMMRLTLEVQIETLYSVSLKDLFNNHPDIDLDDVCKSMMLADRVYGFDPVYAGLSDWLPPFTPDPGSEEAKQKLTAFVSKIVNTFKRNPKKDTLMHYLSTNMTDQQCVETGLVILGAHHEVAAPPISRAWQLLSEHPKVEEELSLEISRVLGGRPAKQADLHKLEYTHMVMREVRRLYPSTWMVIRWSRNERNISGYTIPKGSAVMMSQWVSHHDSNHFEDPYSFKPERWTAEKIRSRKGVSYFPFSKGIRSCAGKDFIELQDAMTLATLVQSITFKMEGKQDLSPLARRSTAPQHGIKGRVFPRAKDL